MGSEWHNFGLLHDHRKYLQDAGYDPAEKALTWDECRDAARKISRAGDKGYYGVIIEDGQAGRLNPLVAWLVRAAGAAQVGEVDLRTGEFFHSPDTSIVIQEEKALTDLEDGAERERDGTRRTSASTSGTPW